MIPARPSLLLCTAALAAAGCSALAQSGEGYAPTDVTDGGAIVGTVTYDGEAPEPALVEVTTTEDVCHADPIYDEQLVVSEEGGVQWAVVSIVKIDSGKPFPDPKAPETRPVIDQKGCLFAPHVAVVPVAQPLTILNSDGVLHNFHTWPKKNRAKNVAMPGPVKEMTMKFRRAENIRVSCDIHPWMQAWIVVSEHPYVAVTDEDGKFELTDVPPGEYALRVWHESFGPDPLEQTVTVGAATESEAEFVLTEASRLKEGR